MDNYTLSPRQFEIAKLIAEGLSDKEIAARLSISLHTVKNTMTEIRRRMGAHSRLGVAVAVMRGAVSVQDMRGQPQASRLCLSYRHGGAR